ncbi:hypothetical protein L7F22_003809 [Adiantum nelumboides]|nr:hypothetical protein [Adiantum nelumboides]
MKCLEAITIFRTSQFDLVKAGLAKEDLSKCLNAPWLLFMNSIFKDYVMNVQPSKAEVGFDNTIHFGTNTRVLETLIEEQWAPQSRNMSYKTQKSGCTPADHTIPWWGPLVDAVIKVGGKLADVERRQSTTNGCFIRDARIPTYGFLPISDTQLDSIVLMRLLFCSKKILDLQDEENKIEDEGDMSQATQQVLPTIDEETPFHKGDAMSTQEVVEHESDFVAQKPSNDMNKGSENMLPTIKETQIHERNTRNSEEKMVVVENQSDVQTSPKPSDDMIIKDTYSMPLRDEEVDGSEKKDEANEEHQGALATTEVQDKVDKGTGEATRNANKAQSIQGRVQGTEGEEREIQERLRREEEEEERKTLEHLRREEEEEERKILEHLRRQEEEEAQKKEEPAVHYKRPRRCKYLDPYFMYEL